MTDRPWSQMLPSEHLDMADALTIEARDREPREAVALRREAELHLLAAQTQALRLQTASPIRPRATASTEATRRAAREHAEVMQLERDALQDQMADDLAAMRDHARATRYRT